MNNKIKRAAAKPFLKMAGGGQEFTFTREQLNDIIRYLRADGEVYYLKHLKQFARVLSLQTGVRVKREQPQLIAELEKAKRQTEWVDLTLLGGMFRADEASKAAYMEQYRPLHTLLESTMRIIDGVISAAKDITTSTITEVAGNE